MGGWVGLFELNVNIKDISLVQDLTIQDDEIVPGKKVNGKRCLL